MQAVAYDILWHGTTSMAGALQWALLFLLHHPDKQARAQDEIDANFPQGNPPLTAEERSKLPYLEAMVLEVGTVETVIRIDFKHTHTHAETCTHVHTHTHTHTHTHFLSLTHMQSIVWNHYNINNMH